MPEVLKERTCKMEPAHTATLTKEGFAFHVNTANERI